MKKADLGNIDDRQQKHHYLLHFQQYIIHSLIINLYKKTSDSIPTSLVFAFIFPICSHYFYTATIRVDNIILKCSSFPDRKVQVASNKAKKGKPLGSPIFFIKKVSLPQQQSQTCRALKCSDCKDRYFCSQLSHHRYFCLYQHTASTHIRLAIQEVQH